jgi:hypothetical protein
MKGLLPTMRSVLLFSYWLCGYYITCGGRAQGVWRCYSKSIDERRLWVRQGDGEAGLLGGVTGGELRESRPGIRQVSFQVADFETIRHELACTHDIPRREYPGWSS